MEGAIYQKCRYTNILLRGKGTVPLIILRTFLEQNLQLFAHANKLTSIQARGSQTVTNDRSIPPIIMTCIDHCISGNKSEPRGRGPVHGGKERVQGERPCHMNKQTHVGNLTCIPSKGIIHRIYNAPPRPHRPSRRSVFCGNPNPALIHKAYGGKKD